MANQISFHPLVDGVLTLVRLERDDGGRPVVDEYALDRDALAEIQALLVETGADPPPLVRHRVETRLRAIGWLHLPTAA